MINVDNIWEIVGALDGAFDVTTVVKHIYSDFRRHE